MTDHRIVSLLSPMFPLKFLYLWFKELLWNRIACMNSSTVQKERKFFGDKWNDCHQSKQKKNVFVKIALSHNSQHLQDSNMRKYNGESINIAKLTIIKYWYSKTRYLPCLKPLPCEATYVCMKRMSSSICYSNYYSLSHRLLHPVHTIWQLSIKYRPTVNTPSICWS